jgi:hypothetical membrane protein
MYNYYIDILKYNPRVQMIMTRKSTKKVRIIRLAGICGVLGSFIVIAIVLLATWLSPWFSWQKNALSELGVGEVSVLFNSAVFIGGLLILIFSFGVRKYINQRLRTDLGVVLLMLASLCLALVGIFTVEFSLIHAVVSLGYFLFAPIGLLLIGLGANDHKVRILSLVIGSLALIAILILPIIPIILPFEFGFAVPEIIHSFILGIWIIYTVYSMLFNPKH